MIVTLKLNQRLKLKSVILWWKRTQVFLFQEAPQRMGYSPVLVLSAILILSVSIIPGGVLLTILHPRCRSFQLFVQLIRVGHKPPRKGVGYRFL